MASLPNAAAERGSGGGVVTLYYSHDQDESFEDDILASLRESTAAKDTKSNDKILDLWLNYFEHRLASADSRRLIRRLEEQRVWRWYEGWPVFKTVDTPCLAFTASVDAGDEKVTLVALGMCYKYPSDDEDLWWHEVILPRVRSL